MNKKGFAATGILYTILILFILLMSSILIMLYSRNNLLNTIKNQVENEIEAGALCYSMIGTVWNYDYIGSEQTFTVPCNGTYKIELWGSSGDKELSVEAGNGAYTSGNINLTSSSTLYVYVGGQAVRTEYSFNGGAPGEAPAGGATDIRLINGKWNNFDSLKSRIMVAGGGGGGFYKSNTTDWEPGHAGGLIGYNADAIYSASSQSPLLEKGYSGYGATQISTGSSGDISKSHQSYLSIGYHLVSSKFALGTYGIDDNGSTYSSGGGGGYYGGGHGVHPGSTWSGGGGGSSFISGHAGSIAITASSTESNLISRNDSSGIACNSTSSQEYNSLGYNTDITCSYHYSGLKFTDTVMIDGAGYNWTITKGSYVGQPQPDGTTAVGHSGNGYARITLVTVD